MMVVDHDDAMNTFEAAFGPIILPQNADDGVDYFEDHSEAIRAAEVLNSEDPLSYFWTIVEAEDEQWVCEGNRFVNRMHMWFVTTKPHNFEGNEFLWYKFDDDTEEVMNA